jgi:hypothetical protein
MGSFSAKTRAKNSHAWAPLTGPPQQDAAPDHLHLGVVDEPPQGGPQEALQLVQVEAGGGRHC